MTDDPKPTDRFGDEIDPKASSPLLFVGGGSGTLSSAWLEPLWSDWRWAFLVVGIVLVRMIRGLPYLVTEPRAFAFLPVYAFLCPFVLAPLRLYGMLTARNSSWMTRGGSASPASGWSGPWAFGGSPASEAASRPCSTPPRSTGSSA